MVGGELGLNPQFVGELMMVKEEIPHIKLGSIGLKVIGPFPQDVTKLGGDWKAGSKRIRNK